MIRFSTGEFARICGVKKATLFHYDEIGLLKPHELGANGYRYYTEQEVYSFDVISALKEVGYPLGAIKAYLDEREPERFLELLRDGRRRLEEERRRIERLDRLFASSYATTEGAAGRKVGVVRVVPCGEEYLIAHEAPSNPAASFYRETFLKVRAHIEYCRSRNLAETMPIGLIFGGAELDAKPLRERWYFSKIGARIEDPHFRSKPAGLYATLFHQGPYDSIAKACRLVKRYIDGHRYEIVGDAYEEDQLSFFTTKEEERYLYKISVQVRKRP